MMNGIDQDVQAKMNAYRGNPQALAQKYSQSQQLIDLLALQKLKSEKEAAARDMQMQMGGNMPTIADSREQEVLDLTKQELAQQTTGAMQTQQRQQQQAAKDLVQRSSQAPMQNMNPMTQGMGALPAPNIGAKAMAAGGIVAFEEGGPTDVAPSGNTGLGALTNQAIRALIGRADPQAAYEVRRKEGTDSSGYTADERAIIQRQIDARAALDADRYDPERRRSESLTRFLLGAAGRTGIGSVLAGAGAANVNYNEAMDSQERAAMLDRQKQESNLVDVGPAARLQGLKAGQEAEKNAILGLHYGADAATRLATAQAAASRTGSSLDLNKLKAAEYGFEKEKARVAKELQTNMITLGDPRAVPYFTRLNEIGKNIYTKFGVGDYFIPDALPESAPAPPPKPTLGQRIQSGLGLSPTEPRPPVVDFNAMTPRR